MPTTLIAIAASGLVAGPFTTEPSLMLNLLPWHGHWMVPPETVPTVQPWWVHTAVNALNEPGSRLGDHDLRAGEYLAAANRDVRSGGEDGGAS